MTSARMRGLSPAGLSLVLAGAVLAYLPMSLLLAQFRADAQPVGQPAGAAGHDLREWTATEGAAQTFMLRLTDAEAVALLREDPTAQARTRVQREILRRARLGDIVVPSTPHVGTRLGWVRAVGDGFYVACVESVSVSVVVDSDHRSTHSRTPCSTLAPS